ncbi:MAG: tyrosine-type recombinase/integrase [Cognaticolwellia sp.]
MDNKLTGIKANNSSITISFTYNDIRCRETVKVKPTKSALKEMARKRDAILYEIEFGQFDYLKHFPNSKTALSLAGNLAFNITIKDMINDWFKRNQHQWERSTIRGYKSKTIQHIEPNFGHINVSEFKPSLFKNWAATATNKNSNTNKPLTGKTINEVRSIMRSAFQDLYIDEVIDSNPIDRIKRFKHTKAEPEPFNAAEREKILAEMTGQVHNFFNFAFWTGLRTSELIGLRKCDVDLKRKVIFVRKAVVEGQEQGTKTKSGCRTHEMHELAFLALSAQMKVTPDNQERVFINPKTNKPWSNDKVTYRLWGQALKKSKVKYRTQYNTRHTYASTMLTEDRPIAWLARQLGHSDIRETLKTYARWID